MIPKLYTSPFCVAGEPGITVKGSSSGATHNNSKIEEEIYGYDHFKLKINAKRKRNEFKFTNYVERLVFV